MTLHFSVGMDLQGDACLYVQVLNDDSAHVRFATEAELERMAEMLTSKADGDAWNPSVATPDEFSHLLDICRLERVA